LVRIFNSHLLQHLLLFSDWTWTDLNIITTFIVIAWSAERKEKTDWTWERIDQASWRGLWTKRI